MLKAIYITLALVTYAPFLLFHGLVSLMVWNAAAWDEACNVAFDIIDSVVSSKN